jgi:hypothetical protein
MVSGPITVDVEIFDGSITVDSDVSGVWVTAILNEPAGIAYSAEKIGNTIEVSARHADLSFGAKPSVDLKILGRSEFWSQALCRSENTRSTPNHPQTSYFRWSSLGSKFLRYRSQN